MSAKFTKFYVASLILTIVFFTLSGVFARQVNTEDLRKTAKVVASRVGEPIELKPLNEEFEVPDSVARIQVEATNGRITVLSSDRSSIRVAFSGRIPVAPERSDYGFRVRNSTLEIKADLSRNSSSSLLGWMAASNELNLSRPEIDVEIEVPRHWTGGLSLTSINGNVAVEDIHLDDARIKTVNGDVSVLSPAVRSLTISAVNADLLVKAGRIGSARLRTIAGEISLKGPISDILQATSVSGDVVIEVDPTARYRFNLSSLSGSITNDLISQESPSGVDLRINTTSGDIGIRALY